MTTFKPQQRHLTIQGREFHFVSYEAVPANPKQDQPEMPAMWYLIVSGRRFPVIEYDEGVSLEEVDAMLSAWAVENAIAADTSPTAQQRTSAVNRQYQNWWGPN